MSAQRRKTDAAAQQLAAELLNNQAGHTRELALPAWPFYGFAFALALWVLKRCF